VHENGVTFSWRKDVRKKNFLGDLKWVELNYESVLEIFDWDLEKSNFPISEIKFAAVVKSFNRATLKDQNQRTNEPTIFCENGNSLHTSREKT
jgi:hypothetical protein